MATPGEKYTSSKWNALVDQINSIISSPPNTSCTAGTPIPNVGPLHRWSAGDITAAQNALFDTCNTLAFTPVNSGDKWLAQYVQELEDALPDAWCDCDADCRDLPECSNCGPAAPNAPYAFNSVDGVFYFTNTTDENACFAISPSNYVAIANANRTAVLNAITVYHDLLNTLYGEKQGLMDLEEDLQDAQDLLDNLEANRDAICGPSPGSPACIAAQAAVDAQEIVRDNLQAQVDAQQAVVDAILTQLPVEKATIEALADAAWDFLESLTGGTCRGDNVAADMRASLGSHPYASQAESDAMHANAAYWGFQATRCRVSWTAQINTDFTNPPRSNCCLTTGGWSNITTGNFTPDGTPIPPSGANVAQTCFTSYAQTCVGVPNSLACSNPEFLVTDLVLGLQLRVRINPPDCGDLVAPPDCYGP